jgi:hypothetical protein
MTRTELHALVDRLSDADAEEVAALLDAYLRGDRVMIQALIAFAEPADAIERRALDKEASMPGDGITLEDYEAKYGLVES